MTRGTLLAMAVVTGFVATAWAQQQAPETRDLLQGILREVIRPVIDAAREQVRANTGIDLLERGYGEDGGYESFPDHASDEVRRELDQLTLEHDRTIAGLEDKLWRKIEKAGTKFAREAAQEDKPEAIEDKRAKFQEKVDTAYAWFQEKIGTENARFDSKRRSILEKTRGS